MHTYACENMFLPVQLRRRAQAGSGHVRKNAHTHTHRTDMFTKQTQARMRHNKSTQERVAIGSRTHGTTHVLAYVCAITSVRHTRKVMSTVVVFARHTSRGARVRMGRGICTKTLFETLAIKRGARVHCGAAVAAAVTAATCKVVEQSFLLNVEHIPPVLRARWASATVAVAVRKSRRPSPAKLPITALILCVCVCAYPCAHTKNRCTNAAAAPSESGAPSKVGVLLVDKCQLF